MQVAHLRPRLVAPPARAAGVPRLYEGKLADRHVRVSSILPDTALGQAIAVQVTEEPIKGVFDTVDWAAAFVSQPEEFEYWIKDVEGQVPDSVRGTLFRMAPAISVRLVWLILHCRAAHKDKATIDRSRSADDSPTETEGSQQYSHMLDGDGCVLAFSFNADGRVHFRSRYVKTKELDEEKKAGRVLFRNTFGTQRIWSLKPTVNPAFSEPELDVDLEVAPAPVQHTVERLQRHPDNNGLLNTMINAFDLHLKNPANTNVLLWGDRLLALWEAGAPYELDPETLFTKGGPQTLGGFITAGIAPSTTRMPALDKMIGLGSALTAHPHVRPATETEDARMVMWSWRSIVGGPLEIDIAEFDEHWSRTGGTKFQMPHSMFNPHDFALTPSHYVFFQNAMKFDMLSYLLGAKGPAQCVEILAGKAMHIHLVPREGGKPQVFTTESSFLIHHANAFDVGDETVVWSSGWSPEALGQLTEGSGMLGSWRAVLRGDFAGIPFTSFLEHRINRKTGKVVRKVLFNEQSGDHPRVNPFFYSKQARYLFFNMSHAPKSPIPNPPQAFGRLDTVTGEVQTWTPGVHCFSEELIFVPGPNAEHDELDGHLLGMVFNGETLRSSLMILDARDFTKGPVCRLGLSHHIPHGLHGCFTERYYGPKAQ